MRVDSTSRIWHPPSGVWAAFAATCFATSPLHADNQRLRLVGVDPARQPITSSSGVMPGIAGHTYLLTGDAPVGQQSTTRETTEQELIIATLRSWERYQSNWDHDGARAPNLRSLRAASSFICALAGNQEMPEAMLHDTGLAGLFWKRDQFYADLEFLENGSIAYYIERGIDRHKGVTEFRSRTIPGVLETLLAA